MSLILTVSGTMVVHCYANNGGRCQTSAINAQHSTGPLTLEGKDISSQNAIKHGLFSNVPLITGDQEEEFNIFSNGLLSFLMPQNGIESILVERIISCAWRLRRVMRMESDMMHESLEFDFRHSLPDLFTNGGEKIMALSRYEMILEKSLYKAYNELLRLQGIPSRCCCITFSFSRR